MSEIMKSGSGWYCGVPGHNTVHIARLTHSTGKYCLGMHCFAVSNSRREERRGELRFLKVTISWLISTCDRGNTDTEEADRVINHFVIVGNIGMYSNSMPLRFLTVISHPAAYQSLDPTCKRQVAWGGGRGSAKATLLSQIFENFTLLSPM